MSDVAYIESPQAQEAAYWEARRQGMGLSDKAIGDLLRVAAPHMRDTDVLWMLAGLVYFAPQGTDPFGRAVVAAAEHLERVGFKPTPNEIRERWVET